MLYDLQNKNVLSLHLKVWVFAGLADSEWESVPRFGSCDAEGSLAEFKSRSRQEEVQVAIGGYVTTKQPSNLMQSSEMEKTCLCRFGDMRLHVQFTVQLDTEVADRRRWLNDVCPHVQRCDGRWHIT